jgi:uncharacterized membrane protein
MTFVPGNIRYKVNMGGGDLQQIQSQNDRDGVLILHRTLRRNSFYTLLFCSVVSLCVLAARVYLSQTHAYMFLVWNLFLAWIPFACAIWVVVMDRVWPGGRWMLVAPAGMWLLFFPNAPYIVTDFIHLQRIEPLALWFDIGLLMLFAWTGCFLGVTSLQMMQSVVRRRIGRIWSWVFVLTTLGLSGVGIYLGRFLRFNSWDILLRPGHLLGNVFDALANPMAHQRAIGVSLMFSLFMLVCYVTFLSARRRSA